MSKAKIWKPIIILVHGLVLWVLCGMVMFIGMEIFSMQTALIVHLVAAPIFAALVSLLYFKKYNYTNPIQTALIFLLVVIFLDFFVVAFLIEKSFEMFASLLGTWIPWALIFASTYLTGLFLTKRAETTTVA